MVATVNAPPPPQSSKKSVPTGFTREHFRQHARKLAVTIAGKSFDADVKEFSTDSLGFNINGVITLEIGGISVPCTVGLNVTIKHSKELPK